MDTDHVQTCTKCGKTPEDILMLACNHDLCLQCAAERLVIEMKKRKPANVSVGLFRASSANSAISVLTSTQKVLLNCKR